MGKDPIRRIKVKLYYTMRCSRSKAVLNEWLLVKDELLRNNNNYCVELILKEYDCGDPGSDNWKKLCARYKINKNELLNAPVLIRSDCLGTAIWACEGLSMTEFVRKAVHQSINWCDPFA